jgi:hypothetical protein
MMGIFRKNAMQKGSSQEAIQLSSDNQSVSEKMTSEPKRFNRQEFNALVRKLSLSKDKHYFLLLD